MYKFVKTGTLLLNPTTCVISTASCQKEGKDDMFKATSQSLIHLMYLQAMRNSNKHINMVS